MALLAPTPGFAGVWFHLAGMISDTRSSEGGTEYSDIQLSTSTTAGYHFLQGFYLGGHYLTSRASGAGIDETGWGPRGGLLLKGFELTASYLPWVRQKVAGFSRSGQGWAVNAGVTMKVLGPTRFGVHLTYWSMLLDGTSSGPFSAEKTRISYLIPQFALALEF